MNWHPITTYVTVGKRSSRAGLMGKVFGADPRNPVDTWLRHLGYPGVSRNKRQYFLSQIVKRSLVYKQTIDILLKLLYNLKRSFQLHPDWRKPDRSTQDDLRESK
jgi:hypothetical protein